MQNIDFTAVNSPSATDAKDGSVCESPYSHSVFSLSFCSQWSIRHLTELRLFDSKSNTVNKVVLHLSGVLVKICLPSKTQLVLKCAL